MRFEDLQFRVIASHGTQHDEAIHRVDIGDAEHGERGKQAVLVAYESHAGVESSRRFDLSTAVHLLLNIEDGELWEISGREPEEDVIDKKSEILNAVRLLMQKCEEVGLSDSALRKAKWEFSQGEKTNEQRKKIKKLTQRRDNARYESKQTWFVIRAAVRRGLENATS